VRHNIILICCFSQILSFLFILFFPADAKEENLVFLFSINALFFILLLLTAFFCYNIFKLYEKKPYRKIIESQLSQQSLFNNVVLLSVLPLIGLFFIVYDRIFIRRIDYSQGLRAARYEWLASEGGSFFGIAGNLMVPVSYIAIFFGIRYFGVIKNKWFPYLLIASFISILGSSMLNGGRSNLLLFLVMVIIALSLNAKKIRIKIKISTCLYIALACAGIFYIFKIMESSASLGGIDLSTITQLGIVDLYGAPDNEFFGQEHSDITYKIVYAFAYLFHGQWTSQAIYGLSDTPGYYSIVAAPTVFLDRIGLLNMELEKVAFAATGPYVALPGAVYYDFRWMGIIIWSMMLGLLLGLILFFINSEKRFGTLKTIFIISILYIIILAPVGPAYGFNHYSFIIIAFLIVGVLNKILFRKNIYY